MFFWTTIRKNRSKYSSARGISEDDVTSILFRDLILGKDPQLAEESLLKLPALRKFDNSLKTKGEKDHFRRHLRKYVNIWLPDCPFEVSTTNRYTIVTQEAATTARRFIKKNDPIKYLCGYLVSMTPEEEGILDQSKRDFSIVMSSRKKTASLFMGPARFANHDCNANARLVTMGYDGMQIVAVRDINLGEEITVTYGDSYFGEGNRECLCETCEKNGRNGWTSPQQEAGPSRVPTPLNGLDKDASPSPYSFRRTRKYSNFTESPQSATQGADEGRPRKRRRIGNKKSNLSLDVEGKGEDSVVKDKSVNLGANSETLTIGSNSYENVPMETTGEGQSSETMKNLDKWREGEEFLRASVTAAFATAKPASSQRRSIQHSACKLQNLLFGANSPHVVEMTAGGKGTQASSRVITPSEASSKSSGALSVVTSLGDSGVPANSSPATTISSTSIGPGLEWKSPDMVPDPASESELSELSDHECLDDITQTVIRKPKKRGRPSKQNHQQQQQKVIPTIELQEPVRETRYPKDYVRTPLLLGESYSRWVDCKTCAGCWVQPNGYLTRKECPRCERHSKLYGYQWPKTDKEGKNDREERVLDHRTVHRFLRHEEEALIKKRGKGVQLAATAAAAETVIAAAAGGPLSTATLIKQDLEGRTKRGGRATRGR